MKKFLFALLFGAFAILGFTQCSTATAQTETGKLEIQTASGQVLNSTIVTASDKGLTLPIRLNMPTQQVAQTDLVAQSSDVGTELKVVFTSPKSGMGFANWLSENKMAFLAVLIFGISIVVNLTPTDKDNSIFLILKRIFDTFIPNRALNGTTHP